MIFSEAIDKVMDTLCEGITEYSHSSNRVQCKAHSWSDFIWVRNSKGIKAKVCFRCLIAHVPDTNAAIPITVLAKCSENACQERAPDVAGCNCISCGRPFCAKHLSPSDECEDCMRDTSNDPTE